jgi:hypothetical protein
MVFAGQINDAEEPAQNALDDARAEDVVTAFKTLLSGLSPEIQERVRASLHKAFPSNITPRPREVLATILKLVPRDRAVTIDEVKKTVEAEGIPATAKTIANALNYLRQKQKVVRVGHGKYMIDGRLWVTSDDLGGGPSKDEEHDANS